VVLPSAVPLAVFTTITSPPGPRHRPRRAQPADRAGWQVVDGGAARPVWTVQPGLDPATRHRERRRGPCPARTSLATGGPGFMAFTELLVARISLPATTT